MESVDFTCKLEPESAMPLRGSEQERHPFAGETFLLSLASQLWLKASLINKVLISSYARFEKAVVLVYIDQYHKIIDEDTRSTCSTIWKTAIQVRALWERRFTHNADCSSPRDCALCSSITARDNLIHDEAARPESIAFDRVLGSQSTATHYAATRLALTSITIWNWLEPICHGSTRPWKTSVDHRLVYTSIDANPIKVPRPQLEPIHYEATRPQFIPFIIIWDHRQRQLATKVRRPQFFPISCDLVNRDTYDRSSSNVIARAYLLPSQNYISSRCPQANPPWGPDTSNDTNQIPFRTAIESK